MAEEELFEELLQWQMLATIESAITESAAIIDDNLYRNHGRMVMYGDDPLYGERYIEKLLTDGHQDRIKMVTRCTKMQFIQLHNWLCTHANLKASSGASTKQKLAIFLAKCAEGDSVRSVMEKFHRSASRIHEYFHQVLDAMMVLHRSYVQMPPPDAPTHPFIRSNYRWWPYFADCIGAIDGTLIPASVRGTDRDLNGVEAWRCRKGFICQNVLAVVDFDMNFIFVHAGWEGAAHDSMVYRDALQKGLLKVPDGKYFLADAGYIANDGYSGTVLSPYARTRYHLKEWRHAVNKPQTASELFNLRHACLRNTVERVFDVLKERFHCLKKEPAGYDIRTQVQLVYALTAVHNFLNQSGSDALQEWLDIDQIQRTEYYTPAVPSNSEKPAGVMLRDQEGLRDVLATYMWDKYTEYMTLEDELEGVDIE